VALGGAAQYGHGGQQRRSLATLLAISPLTPAPRRRRLRILVADDSRDTVATLTTLLQAEGHEVRGVHRSADVLGAEREFRPDVVILDLQMPEISYRERAPLLIALSGAYTRPADATLSRAAGFDHYLTKPYAIGDLLALLA
jgi:DNA-binding response OmpR family regulator